MGALGTDVPTDFVGVTWGASQSEARTTMQHRGARLVPEESDAQRLVFEGGNFAGRTAAGWALDFEEGRFVRGAVRLEKLPKQAEREFRELKSKLNGRYGMGSDAQVGHAKPPHFVLGLGWRSSGTKPPALMAKWRISSGVKPQTVVINLWVDDGRVLVAYANETMKPNTPQQRKNEDL